MPTARDLERVPGRLHQRDVAADGPGRVHRVGAVRDEQRPARKGAGPRAPRPVDHLTEGEGELYEALIAEGWTRFRRVEQERIPLSVAHAAVPAVAVAAAR